MGAGEVRVVVARGEAERVRLDPGHGEWEGSIRLLARPGVNLAARSSPLKLELRTDAQRLQRFVCLIEADGWTHRRGERGRLVHRLDGIEEEGEGTQRRELHRAATTADVGRAALSPGAAHGLETRLGRHHLRRP